MQWHELRRLIRKRYKSGESYHKIGRDLGVSAPTVDRIDHGRRPGKKVSGILGLDPPATLLCTRRRIAKTNAIARVMGFKSWSEYTTCMIELFEGEEGL